MSKTLEFFLKIVKIDSPSGYEKNMISYIINWLKQKKLPYKLDSSGNILAQNNLKSQPILFCVHLDTVEPGRGIKPIIKNGIVKSLGKTILGADNKAAVASLLTAIEEHLKTKQNSRSFELLFTVKEETGGGLDDFPFEWIQSKIAFTFDYPKPLGGIILQSPNIANFYTEIKGKAWHSSEPEKGINALIPIIKSLTKIKIGLLDNGLTTINIGQIHGGSGINTILEKIKIAGEIRSYDKNLFNNHLNKIKKIFSDQSKRHSTKLKFWVDGFCPGYKHDKNDPEIMKIAKIFSKLSLTPKYYLKSAVSDANILNQKGIKTINLTDGVKNSHTINESVTIKNLVKLTEIIKSFLLSY